MGDSSQQQQGSQIKYVLEKPLEDLLRDIFGIDDDDDNHEVLESLANEKVTKWKIFRQMESDILPQLSKKVKGGSGKAPISLNCRRRLQAFHRMIRDRIESGESGAKDISTYTFDMFDNYYDKYIEDKRTSLSSNPPVASNASSPKPVGRQKSTRSDSTTQATKAKAKTRTKSLPVGASKSKAAIASAARAARKGRKGVRCRNLSNEQRASLLQSLLKHKVSNNTKLRKGALLEAARAFGVSTKTCKRIWERFLETSDASGSGGDVSHRKHQSGRPKKISAEELLQKIEELPEETRSSVRGLARALGMPHTTIHRRLKSGEIRLEGLLASSGDATKDAKQTAAKPAAKDNGNSIQDDAIGEDSFSESVNPPKRKRTAPSSQNV